MRSSIRMESLRVKGHKKEVENKRPEWPCLRKTDNNSDESSLLDKMPKSSNKDYPAPERQKMGLDRACKALDS